MADGPAAQYEQALRNIVDILAAEGVALDGLVKLTTYLVEPSTGGAGQGHTPGDPAGRGAGSDPGLRVATGHAGPARGSGGGCRPGLGLGSAMAVDLGMVAVRSQRLERFRRHVRYGLRHRRIQ